MVNCVILVCGYFDMSIFRTKTERQAGETVTDDPQTHTLLRTHKRKVVICSLEFLIENLVKTLIEIPSRRLLIFLCKRMPKKFDCKLFYSSLFSLYLTKANIIISSVRSGLYFPSVQASTISLKWFID